MDSTLSCPKCGTNDRIEMLSAIVAQETYVLRGTTLQQDSYQDKDGHWHTGTYNAPFTGTQTSQLAKYISLPARPAPKPFSLFLTIFAWLMVIGGALFHIMGFFSLFLGSFLAGPTLEPLISEMSSNPLAGILAGVLGIAGGLISICVPFLVFEFVAIGLPIIIFRKRKKHQIREKNRVAYELPLWQKAMSKWDTLYYCRRDDLVFDPGNHSSFSPEKIIDYCFR